MIFDSLLLYAIKEEMIPIIRGGVVQKIKQTGKDEIYIDIHSLGSTHSLFFSANPKFPRFYLTSSKAKALPKAPDFCMIMRKYLEGAFLTEIEQIGFDRIVKWTFTALEGDKYCLISEIMGKHSNLILTDSASRILACIKSVGSSMSSVRQILIGREYTLPPNAERIDPLTCSERIFLSVAKNIQTDSKEEQIKEIIKNFSGISPFLANEIFYETDIRDTEKSWRALSELREICEKKTFVPTLVMDRTGKAVTVYPIALKSVPKEYQAEKTSLNDICAVTARSIINEEIFQSVKAGLLSQINNALSYRKKAIKDCNTAIDKGESDKNLHIGELLKASMHKIKKGDRYICLTDYYSPSLEEIKIELDEKLTPAENTEKYFRRHKKQKEAARLAKEKIVSLTDSLEILEREKAEVMSETRTSNLRERGEKLKQAGLLRTEKGQKEEEKKLFGGFNIKRIMSPDGFEIYYGESATANDHLTTKIARPNDIWLHARQITGAHVIIRTNVKNCKNVPHSTLLFAAKTASQNSTGKHSSMVPVDWTYKKYVRKPKGSPPGFVLYVNEKTVDVLN